MTKRRVFRTIKMTEKVHKKTSMSQNEFVLERTSRFVNVFRLKKEGWKEYEQRTSLL